MESDNDKHPTRKRVGMRAITLADLANLAELSDLANLAKSNLAYLANLAPIILKLMPDDYLLLSYSIYFAPFRNALAGLLICLLGWVEQ